MNVRRKNQKGGNRIVKFICRVLKKIGLPLKSCNKFLESVDQNVLNEVLNEDLKEKESEYHQEERTLNDMPMKIFEQLENIKKTWLSDKPKVYGYFEKNNGVKKINYLGIIESIEISLHHDIAKILIVNKLDNIIREFFYNINANNVEVRIEKWTKKNLNF